MANPNPNPNQNPNPYKKNYDNAPLRVAQDGLIHEAPPGYISFQKIINSDNGYVNADQFNKHIDMMENQGWGEIENVPTSILNILYLV